MDYFSKFKKRIIPPKVQLTTAMQLAKFHKCWDYVHNIFIAEDRKSNLHVKQTEIPERLRQMVDMLVDEEARQEDNTTGVCMEYFLKNGILQYLVNVSEKMDYPEGIRGEGIRTIASMVDLLDDRFLVHNAVHKPTIKLLRFCVLDERQSELDHEDLVDLMYIICSKIHGFPALLNIFFHDKQWLTTPQRTLQTTVTPAVPIAPGVTTQSSSDAPPPTPLPTSAAQAPPPPPEYEFLLFTYLLRFVHREGRSGDFARTGLLFLMEMATHQLGDFILESDFATIMAAGLGALYSQLPRKLIIKDTTEIHSSPASFLLGQDLDPRAFPTEEVGIEQSNSDQFKYQLDSFLKLLEFCQDILTRCPNDAISDRLLQCVRMIFLENILYPSILECSDVDGSSVAVLSYIDLILQTVHQQDLADVMVGFLMDDEDQDTKPVSPSSTTNTTNIFAGVEFDRFKSPPYFTAERFTLKDLIFSRLKSSSQPTVIATLKLLKTLIIKHCRFANRLLSTTPDTQQESRVISHHIREIELYFALVSAIDRVHVDDILTLGYEDYLKDIEAMMAHDACFQQATTTTTTPTRRSEKRRSFKYGQRLDFNEKEQNKHAHTKRPMQRHRIRPTDTLIQILLGLLSHFFAQSSELNLALTGVISALAMCPYRSLEGWISFCEADRTHADDVLHLTDTPPPVVIDGIRSNEIYALTAIEEQQENCDDDDQSVDFGAERNSVRMTRPTQFKSFPPFYTLFRTLTQQIDYYRSEVDGFDRLLDERWNGLLFGEGNLPPVGTPSLSSSTKRGDSTGLENSPKLYTTQRRNSVLKASASASTINMTAPNPSKSLSSSTTAAAMAVNGGGVGVMTASTSSNTSTPIASSTSSAISTPAGINPLSPLAIHAKKTRLVRIQPLFPSNFEIERDEPILNLDQEDEDMFTPRPSCNPSQRKKMDKTTEISLSMLLNNVVILEETIKELVAIMQVRRSLGIDKIRYA